MERARLSERGHRARVEGLGAEVRASAVLILVTVAVLATVTWVGVAIS